jgi:hypothetical protein
MNSEIIHAILKISTNSLPSTLNKPSNATKQSICSFPKKYSEKLKIENNGIVIFINLKKITRPDKTSNKT